MAKTKTGIRQKKKQKKQMNKSPEELYALALTSLGQSEPEQALRYAQVLLTVVDSELANSATAVPKTIALPALNLLGEISVELGEIDQAVRYFTLSVQADPTGALPDEQGGGAEKFLWLAQLSEEGGADSVQWFEKGITVLKAQIAALQDAPTRNGHAEEAEILLEEKRAKVANALCAVTEIYMTDLSWETDAEARCETLVTEAIMFAPESAEVLQTMASVRLSQSKLEDARSALHRSITLWKDLEPEDEDVPDFSTRVSLARLLMEAELEEEAMEVLHRLKLEDDQSVEACYLGGWCLHLLADRRNKGQTNGNATNSEEDLENLETFKSSRVWLLNTLKLYKIQDYEDDRLKEHTEEPVADLEKILGPVVKGAEEEEEEEWVEEESGDEEMADS